MSKELSKALKALVKAFLVDREIDTLEIEFSGLEISETELKRLVGDYDSRNRSVHNEAVTDEYTYNGSTYKVNPDISNTCVKYMRKLILAYNTFDTNGSRSYVLYYVRGFYDKAYIECNES
jgi:hypothetical protein